jgi:hypothetical protein
MKTTNQIKSARDELVLLGVQVDNIVLRLRPT